MMRTFYCKMCGIVKDFESKEEFHKYKDKHRPKVGHHNRVYNCKFKKRYYTNKRGNYKYVLVREDLYDKIEGLEDLKSGL